MIHENFIFLKDFLTFSATNGFHTGYLEKRMILYIL